MAGTDTVVGLGVQDTRMAKQNKLSRRMVICLLANVGITPGCTRMPGLFSSVALAFGERLGPIIHPDPSPASDDDDLRPRTTNPSEARLKRSNVWGLRGALADLE